MEVESQEALEMAVEAIRPVNYQEVAFQAAWRLKEDALEAVVEAGDTTLCEYCNEICKILSKKFSP